MERNYGIREWGAEGSVGTVANITHDHSSKRHNSYITHITAARSITRGITHGITHGISHGITHGITHGIAHGESILLCISTGLRFQGYNTIFKKNEKKFRAGRGYNMFQQGLSEDSALDYSSA
ncbi:hypothetical protein DPMN_117681 [Dreissena polymorpha]|uniref:Uncharacterized protein n=1 Tax=Dreissena polymorpha TaxID=45954 RepID=A0A9D4JQF5_DREPO|nr:hypothetical protein DPMN_117681 [Dreissena polymorpha]